MNRTVAQSEALFGSAARGDADALSDIDYLVVDDDPAFLRKRKQWLASRGFSVADYTWKRLERAISQKTLFTVHLKLESRLVHDPEGRLQDLLGGLCPKDDYECDYELGLDLFSPIQSIPASAAGRAWALDVLAVGFRNSAIMSLANEGRYVFSCNEILHELRRRGRIGSDEFRTLHGLRGYKRLYRGGNTAHISRETVDEVARAVDVALKLGLQVCEVAVKKIPDVRCMASTTYSWMRTIEREIISIPAAWVASNSARELRERLLRTVRDPHGYLWQYVHKRQHVLEDLRRLRSAYTL